MSDSGPIKAGDVWETSGRHGAVTVRLLEDVDPHADRAFLVQIVSGDASGEQQAFFPKECRFVRKV